MVIVITLPWRKCRLGVMGILDGRRTYGNRFDDANKVNDNDIIFTTHKII